MLKSFIKSIFAVVLLITMSAACKKTEKMLADHTIAGAQKMQLSSSKASLTNDQRKAYLYYYTPVIFKRSDENNSDRIGQDWISNFFFDKSKTLADNKANWGNKLTDYILNYQHANWEIRPTMYTSFIEFYDHEINARSVILIYHIYNAKQFSSIHDWERVEIRINSVAGVPESGEKIKYVVITRHSLHNAREYPSDDLNFMETAGGKHVMIWQAQGTPAAFGLGIGEGELHFVEDDWATIDSRKSGNGNAEVDINNSGNNAFHYVFVNDYDAAAVSYWNAKKIQQSNAKSLASKQSGTTVSMNQ